MQSGNDFHEQADSKKESAKQEMSEKTKLSLRRLSNFYNGGDVSLPIHRSEQIWEESHGQVSVAKGCSVERRQRRFQALAEMINSWEE